MAAGAGPVERGLCVVASKKGYLVPIELHNKQTRTTSIKRKHFLVGPPILLHEESVDFAITYFLFSGNSQRVWALNTSCPQVIFFWISGPTKLFSQQKKDGCEERNYRGAISGGHKAACYPEITDMK